MNERLLTPEIHAETIWGLLILQDTKTRAATLRECGEWLDSYGGQTPMVMLDEGIEKLRRGEAPWEVQP